MYNNLYYYNKYKFRVVATEGREAGGHGPPTSISEPKKVQKFQF